MHIFFDSPSSWVAEKRLLLYVPKTEILSPKYETSTDALSVPALPPTPEQKEDHAREKKSDTKTSLEKMQTSVGTWLGLSHLRSTIDKNISHVFGEQSTRPSSPDRLPPATAQPSATLLPHTLDVTQWTPTQAAIVSSATLGAVALGALLFRIFRKKKEKEGDADNAKETSQKSAFLTMLSWIPFVGLAAVGAVGAHHMMQKIDGYAKIIDEISRKSAQAMDAVRTGATEMKDRALGMAGLSPDAPSEHYGLTSEKYTQAMYVFRTLDDTSRRQRIGTIFGVKEGKKHEEFERFMRDMEATRKGNDILPESGVRYLPLKEAIENYEHDIGRVLDSLAHYILQHEGEFLLLGYGLYQIGMLKTVLQGTYTSVEKATKITAMFTRWGIKNLASHPLLAVLAFGGSLATLKTLDASTYLPENLAALYSATTNNKPIAVRNDQPVELSPAIRQNIAAFMLEGDFETWTRNQIETLWGTLTGLTADMVTESPEDIIADRTARGFSALRRALDMGIDRTKYDTSDALRKSGFGSACVAALVVLQNLETAYIDAHCIQSSDVVPSRQPEYILQDLIKILTAPPLNMHVEARGGIVTWSADELPPQCLCVDPRITDRKKIVQLSTGMSQKDSTLTVMLHTSLEYIRLKHHDVLKSLSMESSTGAKKLLVLALHDGFYVFTGMKDFLYVPIDFGSNILDVLAGNEDGHQFMARLTGQFLECTAFTLSATAASKLKQFAIGGGQIQDINSSLGKKLFSLTKILPVTSQAHWIQRAVAISGYESDMRRSLGYVDGRRFSLACAHTGIHPQWIHDAYTTRSIAVLQDIASKINKPLDDSLLELEEIRKEVLDHMEGEFKKYKFTSLKQMKSRLAKLHIFQAGNTIGLGDIESLMKQMQWTQKELKQLHTSGSDVADLLKKGANPRRLLSFWSPNELLEAGADPSVLLRAGVGRDTLLAAGVTSDTLDAIEDMILSSARTVTKNEKIRAQNLQLFEESKPWQALTKDLSAEHLSLLEDASAKLHPNTVQKILKDERAMKLLAGALKTGDAGEVQRIVTAAQKAGKYLTAGVNALGLGLDAFGIYIAYCDWQENKNRIIQTKNPNLRALYEEANTLYLVEGGTSAVGLVIGGTAIATSLVGGETIVTAAAASGGAIMLPVGLAVAGMRYVHKDLEAGSERWLRTPDDWNTYSPHDLLSKLETLDAGASFVQRKIVGDTVAEGADTGVKASLYAAYFMKTASLERRAIPSDTNEMQQESDEDFSARLRRFVTHALIYIKKITHMRYQRVDAAALHAARTYATLCDLHDLGVQTISFPTQPQKSFSIDAVINAPDADILQTLVQQYEHDIVETGMFDRLCIAEEERDDTLLSRLSLPLRDRLVDIDRWVGTEDSTNPLRAAWREGMEKRLSALLGTCVQQVRLGQDAMKTNNPDALSDAHQKFDTLWNTILALLDPQKERIQARGQKQALGKNAKDVRDLHRNEYDMLQF